MKLPRPADTHDTPAARERRNRTQRPDAPAIDDEPDPRDSFTERRLVVPASDTKGRSERIWVRMPPLMIRGCQMLVASGQYPWKTPGDFQRFAIHDAMRRLQRDAPSEVVSVISQVEAMKGILQHEEMHAEFLGVFERMSRVVEAYRASNAHDEARRTIAEMRAQINGMPSGYWRSEYRKKLKERYGALMNADDAGNFIELGRSVTRSVEATGDEHEDESGRPPHGDDDDEVATTDSERDLD